MCDERSIPWLVFRGISDYGDKDKDGSWQTVAALSAATCARKFLEIDYRLPTKRGLQAF
jgi:nucleoside phosphorylase